MSLKTSDKVSYQQIRQYFGRDSEFLTLLPSLLYALDWTGNPRELVENLPHFADTINLVELRNTLVRLGYKSEQIKIEITNIPDSLFPILYVPENDKSLIILKRTKNGYLTITDETEEEKEMSLREYTGTAYFFSKLEETSITAIQKTTWFYEHILQYKWVIGQALLISFMINVLLLSTPLYIMNIYNRVVPAGSSYMLFSFIAAILFILITINLLQIVRMKILAYIGAKADRTIGFTLLRTILYLPSSYTENTPIGKQLARIKEFDTIRDFFASPMMVMTFEAPFTLIFIIVIWILGGALVIIPLSMIVIFSLLYYLSIVYVNRRNKIFLQINSNKQTLQLETLTNMQDIKIMGEEKFWLNKYKETSASATYANYQASTLTATMGVISDTLMMMAGLFILIFGTNSAIDEKISLGALIAIMMLTWKTLTPLKTFFASLPKLQQLLSSIKQINNLATIQTEKSTKREITHFNWRESEINFARVSFRYRSELAPALLGVDFTLKPNQFICIVGGSGSGKSTILKLLLQLYSPQAGNIFINGTNINQIDLFEFRHYVSYLPQTIDLFYGTILQNILFANPTATKQEIEIATRLACVYDEIMRLAEQFNSRIGDQASNTYSISFQKRICLARAYLKQSNILLLDEPESTLDTKSSKDLGQVLDYFRGKRTIIMATHRPTYMRSADRILYLKEGQLILDDTPEKVFAKVSIEDL